MKWRLVAVVLVILAGIFLWLGNRGDTRIREVAANHGKSETDRNDAADIRPDNPPLRTKASYREEVSVLATHSPARLNDFILPDLEIHGDLRSALRQVLTVYEETCAKTGETPLPLKFDLPQGNGGMINIRLSAKNFSSSVKLLAALSGMKVSRDGVNYRLEPLADERREVKTEIRVPPDLASQLGEMAGTETNQSLAAILSALGLTLDPTTRVKASAGGIVSVETQRPADAAAIAALAREIGNEQPLQLKTITKTIEVPASAEWTLPDVGRLNDDQVQLMCRALAQKLGTDLLTMPSVLALSGQPSTIEIVRDLNWQETSGENKSQPVGVTLAIEGNFLGFGQEMDFHYSDTSGTVDGLTGTPDIKTNADIADTSFVSKGGTIFRVENRPDGSKRILLLKSTQIDATGRPVP